ncbi:MAG: FAD-dependent oxidoreductase [Candidatus Sulfobium sp.]|jgi:protoporphyrinogen oxidase
MHKSIDQDNTAVILGGGLTGLSAGYVLSDAGMAVKVFESGPTVGGLSRTIESGGFRFDLGGHRFFTTDERINDFVRELMGEELITVSRTSKIFMRGRYFDYPLKPLNAMFGLGIPVTLRIFADYGLEKAKGLVNKSEAVSLEDWVVNQFGRTMFNIYFKGYSEKVWGIGCDRISAEWVAQRIRGLSLAKAVKNAFFKFSGKDVPSLVDRFMYPRLGIGRLSDRMKEEIDKVNRVYTGSTVERINHSGYNIESIVVRRGDRTETVPGRHFVSSMPLTALARSLDPAPPEAVLEAAARLRFRDLVVVAVMLDGKRATDQTWIYIPEQKIPFGRVHEPTNWSEDMAPAGKTLLVTEFFSFKGDEVWSADDETLAGMAVDNLGRLGFIDGPEVIGSRVVRVPNAYPLFDVGYGSHCDEIHDYLRGFENLYMAGRCGMFKYYNMDHAIESGIKAAEAVISGATRPEGGTAMETVLAGDEPCAAR